MTRSLLLVLAALILIAAAAAWRLWPRELMIDHTDRALAARGEPLYRQHCASCHGARLEGQPDWTSPNEKGRRPAPPHDDSGHTWHHDDQVLFEVTKFGVAADGRRALERFHTESPALVILDLMLPELPGLDVCRMIRAESDVPVIMLTARAEEQDKVTGLEGGADDYVTKPFSPRELLARINAVLRRAAPGGGQETLDLGGLSLDTAGHRVSVDGRTVALGPTEYRLLQFFMEHAERVYSRSQLLDRVWGGNVYVEERTVDVHIRRLRKALEPIGKDGLVQTVRGSGYRFSTRPE